jgi:hypothetical protein
LALRPRLLAANALESILEGSAVEGLACDAVCRRDGGEIGADGRQRPAVIGKVGDVDLEAVGICRQNRPAVESAPVLPGVPRRLVAFVPSAIAV